MGQKYEGTLIIQTTNDYSPVGSQTLAALENSAFSDDILSGKSLYSQNGQLLKGSFVDGWPIEIGTEEEMDAFATLDNVERYVKYVENNASVQPEPIVVGDTITQLYFNTSVTPDIGALKAAIEADGGYDEKGGGYTIMLVSGHDVMLIPRSDETPDVFSIVYYNAETDRSVEAFNGETNSWTEEATTGFSGTVEELYGQSAWGAYIAKEPFNASGAPVPVSPIAVGDTLTRLYFNTSVTPDFSLLNWDEAENVEGMEIIALVNSEGLTAGQSPLCVVKMTNSTLGGIVNEVYILQCNIESDNNLYYQCTPEDVEFLVQNGATPNQWLTTNEPFVLEKEVVVSVVNQQDKWGTYIAKEPFNAVAAKASNVPAPVNPIAVGDNITTLYFNTSVQPDPSVIDWSSASGSDIEKVALIGGAGNLSFGRLSGSSGYNYVLTFSNGSMPWVSEGLRAMFGAPDNGWVESEHSIVSDNEVTSVNQQDVWGAYISKDGQWTGGAKYTSGQVYKVVQNGDIVELKEIQY